MMIDQMLFENGLNEWVFAVAIAAAIVTVLMLAKWLVIHRLSRFVSRTETQLDDSLIEIARATRLWLLSIPALYIGSHSLALDDKTVSILQAVATLALLVQLGLWLVAFMEAWFGRTRSDEDAAATSSIAIMRFIGKLVVWSIILLMALDNLGVDITALIAGLGVGGIAVALAVQNILGDLFASLSIVIDKPFVVGDFIIVDDYMGTVEAIGLKTTRVRSLGGEQLVFANNDLLGTRIRNYKRMRERRIVFEFGVLYQTPADVLEEIPAMVRQIIGNQEGTRFDRAHFKAFGSSSYNFEVVYWMLNPDYNRYMDAQQAINLALVRAFEKAGVEFAYPTRTLFIEKSGNEAPLQQSSATA